MITLNITHHKYHDPNASLITHSLFDKIKRENGISTLIHTYPKHYLYNFRTNIKLHQKQERIGTQLVWDWH